MRLLLLAELANLVIQVNLIYLAILLKIVILVLHYYIFVEGLRTEDNKLHIITLVRLWLQCVTLGNPVD